jgi:hypothetical protein
MTQSGALAVPLERVPGQARGQRAAVHVAEHQLAAEVAVPLAARHEPLLLGRGVPCASCVATPCGPQNLARTPS